MKKLIISVLISVLLITAVFGMVGCEKDVWRPEVLDREIVSITSADDKEGYYVHIRANYEGGKPSDKVYRDGVYMDADKVTSKNHVRIYRIEGGNDEFQNIEESLKIENGVYEATVLVQPKRFDGENDFCIQALFYLEEDDEYISKIYEQLNDENGVSESQRDKLRGKLVKARVKIYWTFKISDYI